MTDTDADTDKPTLSAVILSQNEAANIRACIESVRWADEVLIFDSGSDDGTQQIATELGARVETSGPWAGFGRQRQRAQEAATSEWILMIDADERVTPQLRASIEQALANNDPEQVYAVNRSSYFFGRFIRHSGWYPDRVARLYRRDRYHYNDAQVHEQLDCPAGKTEVLAGDLLHYTCTEFQPFVTKSVRYAADWARARHARGKRSGLTTALLHAFACFIRKYLFQRGFLDGKHGFLLAILASQYVFNKYAALWALQQQEKQQGEKQP
ncbi:glycosyltransferase family 2 protein [Motiliproteus sp. SC1-56]|uniref:glycosyltransferase family 2 protein n=1 Tax=Motiliproteus sp. SC1-56 TaxID=2799565 RepID=UPI001A8F3597|nr:glycosyltransferase family 2 protein [Motiliproteus sp. SC1-56]